MHHQFIAEADLSIWGFDGLLRGTSWSAMKVCWHLKCSAAEIRNATAQRDQLVQTIYWQGGRERARERKSPSSVTADRSGRITRNVVFSRNSASSSKDQIGTDRQTRSCAIPLYLESYYCCLEEICCFSSAAQFVTMSHCLYHTAKKRGDGWKQ